MGEAGDLVGHGIDRHLGIADGVAVGKDVPDVDEHDLAAPAGNAKRMMPTRGVAVSSTFTPVSASVTA